jgi:hypothetical protein
MLTAESLISLSIPYFVSSIYRTGAYVAQTTVLTKYLAVEGVREYEKWGRICCLFHA